MCSGRYEPLIDAKSGRLIDLEKESSYMNTVRERVLIGITPYLEFPEHKDLISFCIDSELFEDWDEVEENEGNAVADFNEVIVIVEKEWLFTQMKHEGIDNPLKYLQEEYVSDDSYNWFIKAKRQGKVVLVGFN